MVTIFKHAALAVAALGLLLPDQAGAVAPVDPPAAFGARESVQSISLSPDGRRIAYVAPASGQGSVLLTADLGGTQPPRVAVTADGEHQRLSRCHFVSNQRLVCTIFAIREVNGEPVPFSRLIAVNSDGSNIRVLGERDSDDQLGMRTWSGSVIDYLPGEDDDVLMMQRFIPEGRLVTRVLRTQDGVGVVRVDTANLATRTVETPRPDIAGFISDGRGTIRIMATYVANISTGANTDQIRYLYRKAGSRDWEPLGSYDLGRQRGLSPVAVDPALNAAYAFDDLDGRQALYRIALDGSLRRELVASHPQVDVDGLLRIGRRNRVVGTSYATDRRDAVYFDPELRRLAGQLHQAIPNLPIISFIDSSEDESRLLIWAGSDVDPGRFYTYDRASRTLNEIMLVRPDLENVRLAQVRAIAYRAADGTMIPAYLTLPPGGTGRGLPAIVMPHGGPAARDEWGFDWLAQYFANRGYAVLQPNFRGSAGYGEAWFQQNGFISWRTAIGDVNDAGRWLVGEGIADPAKLAIFGWSYGGYAALQSAVLDPGLFHAIVAVAPVTDLTLLKEEWRNWSNFRQMSDYIGTGAHIREGSPAQNAARIRAPVLIFHGDRDRNVNVRQSQLMEDRLRGAGRQSELVVYPGLDHQLDDSAARTDMLRRSDAFLRQALEID